MFDPSAIMDEGALSVIHAQSQTPGAQPHRRSENTAASSRFFVGGHARRDDQCDSVADNHGRDSLGVKFGRKPKLTTQQTRRVKGLACSPEAKAVHAAFSARAATAIRSHSSLWVHDEPQARRSGSALPSALDGDAA